MNFSRDDIVRILAEEQVMRRRLAERYRGRRGGERFAAAEARDHLLSLFDVSDAEVAVKAAELEAP